jgi:hypothetical protein
VVTSIESATEYKDIALGAFLDKEAAFDRISFGIIKQAAKKHYIEPAICRWICPMLESTNITATLSGETWKRPWSGAVCREVCFCLCCEACSWMIFFGNSVATGFTQ